MARASREYCNRVRYELDDNSDEAVRYTCQGLRHQSDLNEFPYEKTGFVLTKDNITRVTNDWKFADFIPGVIAKRLEYAQGIESFSPNVVASDIGAYRAIEELGRLMASEGLATTWNDHRALMILHCHRVAPGTSRHLA